ncbi:hypothetical protein QM588_05105 [Rhodococcus sp. IEGM 1354]|uniref:hypothetical protein n=1 Tax=Rhodococcus sp. IEGM 1354 TaxID=3047088 RepID=UPI0024B66FBA|nr:hypothetical protein [Rhodococcus sp. IEGM 1354]MDI9929775.1 hypothetical protein [Rhodococcus sp. IEGM 1354]
MAEITITRKTVVRPGRRTAYKFHIARLQDSGRYVRLDLSPKALRALADQIYDALTTHEEETRNDAGTTQDD